MPVILTKALINASLQTFFSLQTTRSHMKALEHPTRKTVRMIERYLKLARDPLNRTQTPIVRLRAIRTRKNLADYSPLNEATLAELSRNAYLNLARYHLELARLPGNTVINHALWPRFCIRQAKATFSEIGTSPEELLMLSKRAEMRATLSVLVKLPAWDGSRIRIRQEMQRLRYGFRLAAKGYLRNVNTEHRQALAEVLAAYVEYMRGALEAQRVTSEFIRYLRKNLELIPPASRVTIGGIIDRVERPVRIRELKEEYTFIFHKWSNDEHPDVRATRFKDALRKSKFTLKDVGITKKMYAETLLDARIEWVKHVLRTTVSSLFHQQAVATSYEAKHYTAWDENTVRGHVDNVNKVRQCLELWKITFESIGWTEDAFQVLIPELEKELGQSQDPRDRFLDKVLYQHRN